MVWTDSSKMRHSNHTPLGRHSISSLNKFNAKPVVDFAYMISFPDITSLMKNHVDTFSWISLNVRVFNSKHRQDFYRQKPCTRFVHRVVKIKPTNCGLICIRRAQKYKQYIRSILRCNLKNWGETKSNFVLL